MAFPQVSVIIPSYNHAGYLPSAIQSILAQTFADWEAIIVDDGSTDDTPETVIQFVDSRIRYIYQENRGLSGARNTGIGAAQGTLVAFLDADDAWMPDFLARMVGLLDADASLGGAYCGFRYMDEIGAPLGQHTLRVVPPDHFRMELLRGCWIIPSSVVVRMHVIQQIGLFENSLSGCADYDLWLRIAERYRFAGVPEVLVWYRRSGNNMSDGVRHMTDDLERVYQKHLGSLDTPVATWPALKRESVANIYAWRTLEFLAQGKVKESAKALLWLLDYRSEFACSLDLWYSLACVHQPIGQRGDFDTWDPERGAADTQSLLKMLEHGDVHPNKLRRMRGKVYFALALLNYGGRRIGPARQSLRVGLRAYPSLVTHSRTWQLIVRLLPGMAQMSDLISRSGEKNADP